MRLQFILLLGSVGLLTANASHAAPPTKEADTVAADQAKLRNALLPTDTAGLIRFLKVRAGADVSPEVLNPLIQALASSTSAARQQACADLVATGTAALPSLRRCGREATPAAPLAQQCWKIIEADGGALTIAAIRLLAHHRPTNTAQILLDYLPHSENETVQTELKKALSAVTYTKGLADPVVLAALSDKHPLLRLFSIAALVQGNISQHQEQLRKLLLDPVPMVRARAALLLAQADDSHAISLLVALLGDLSGKEAREVEDFLTDLASDLGPKIRLNQAKVTPQQVRDAWSKWWRDIEGDRLLEELKKRTISESDSNKIQALIQKLGADNFREREKAEGDLLRQGAPILPLLRQALLDPDPEIQSRLRRCIIVLEEAKKQAVPLFPVIARLIALRKPPGAAKTILACLPSMDDEDPVEELQHALQVVAYTDGKAQPVLLEALNDKSGVRRAAAAQALCAGPWAGHAKSIRLLLRDPDPRVRLKVALALASARDRSAVPTLITLVAELPEEQALQAEDYLNQLARDDGPKALLEKAEDRKKRSEVWSTWWEANKENVVLVDLMGRAREDRAQLGMSYTRWLLKNAAPDPGSLQQVQNQVGKILVFKVTGQPQGGGLWGTDMYTSDSSLAAAAVHAGMVKVGETGAVCVKVLGPQANFVGSTRNGVTSSDFGNYPGAYQILKPSRAVIREILRK